MNDTELYRRLDTLAEVTAGLQRGVDEILARMRGSHSAYSRTFCHICGGKLECENQEHDCKPMEAKP